MQILFFSFEEVKMGNSNAKVDENKQQKQEKQCNPEIMKVFIELTNDRTNSPIDFGKLQVWKLNNLNLI